MTTLEKLEELIYVGFKDTGERCKETDEKFKETDRHFREITEELRKDFAKTRKEVANVTDALGALFRKYGGSGTGASVERGGDSDFGNRPTADFSGPPHRV